MRTLSIVAAVCAALMFVADANAQVGGCQGGCNLAARASQNPTPPPMPAALRNTLFETIQAKGWVAPKVAESRQAEVNAALNDPNADLRLVGYETETQEATLRRILPGSDSTVPPPPQIINGKDGRNGADGMDGRDGQDAQPQDLTPIITTLQQINNTLVNLDARVTSLENKPTNEPVVQKPGQLYYAIRDRK